MGVGQPGASASMTLPSPACPDCSWSFDEESPLIKNKYLKKKKKFQAESHVAQVVFDFTDFFKI